MHETGADKRTDTTEVHLPERWAVLEEALRQIHAEDAARRVGPYPGENRPGPDRETHSRRSLMR